MTRFHTVSPMQGLRGGRSRGFGLVDTLVGFALLITGFFFCMNLIPVSERGVRAARSNVLATHFAGSQLEMTRALSFDTIVSSTPSPMTLTVVVNGSTQGVVFTPTITVTTISQNLKDVACTVTWKDEVNSGLTRRVFLETLVVKRN